MSGEQPTTGETREQWAIVELFGHARIAGRITEQVIGGQSFVRIDVPEIRRVVRRGRDGADDEIETIAAHTRSFGGAAIYSINWVDERAAKAAAQAIRHLPIGEFALRDALKSMTDSDRQELLASPVQSLLLDADGHDDDPPY